MSIKCKYSDIKAIFDWYHKYADEKMAKMYNTQPSTHLIAYFTPSQANWSYQIGLVMVDGVPYTVVSVFGQIKAVMPANIPEYTMAELDARHY